MVILFIPVGGRSLMAYDWQTISVHCKQDTLQQSSDTLHLSRDEWNENILSLRYKRGEMVHRLQHFLEGFVT